MRMLELVKDGFDEGRDAGRHFRAGRPKWSCGSTAPQGAIINMTHSSSVRRLSVIVLLSILVGGVWVVRVAARHSKVKVLGLNKVIAFTYTPHGYDPKQLHSVTLVGPVAASEWKYWQGRGVLAGAMHQAWTELLRFSPGQSRGQAREPRLWRQSPSRGDD